MLLPPIRYGDLNCQKLFGVSTGLYGFFSTLAALVDFRVACGLSGGLPPWRTVETVRVAVAAAEGGGWREVEVVLTAGPGYVLLVLAALLKAVDVLCHLFVPTPAARHSHPLRGGGAGGASSLSLAAYMRLATTPLPQTAEEGGGSNATKPEDEKARITDSEAGSDEQQVMGADSEYSPADPPAGGLV